MTSRNGCCLFAPVPSESEIGARLVCCAFADEFIRQVAAGCIATWKWFRTMQLTSLLERLGVLSPWFKQLNRVPSHNTEPPSDVTHIRVVVQYLAMDSKGENEAFPSFVRSRMGPAPLAA